VVPHKTPQKGVLCLYRSPYDIPSDILLFIMKTFLYQISGCLFIGLSCLLILPFEIAAQTDRAGVNISPARIDDQMNPGEVREFQIKVRNRSPLDEMYFLSVRNISGVGVDGGTPIFSTPRAIPTGYELSDWVTLPTESVLLPGNEEMVFTIRISVPESAVPGSHFGAVFVANEPPNIDQSGAAVGFQVANIIHIRVAGEVSEQASIRQFSTNQFFYGSKNVEFTARIENAGNTLITPVGEIELFSMLGRSIVTIPFNQSNLLSVFPKDTRSFAVSWSDPGIGFGRYEALITVGYGDAGARQTLSNTVTFWILPLQVIGPALGVLAILLIITYIIARLYISRTLAQYQEPNTRRLVRRRKQSSSLPLLVLLIMLVVTALFLLLLLVLFA